MKILYLVSNSSLSIHANTGYGRHIRETVHGLQRLGYTVEVMHAIEPKPRMASSKVIQSESSSELKRLIPKLLWETFRDAQQLRLNATFKRRIVKKIRDFQPDLVYERTSYLNNTITANTMLLPWYLEVNSPFVEQREVISGSSLLQFLAHRFETEKYKLCSGVFSVSSALATFLMKRYGVDGQKIIVNPNGVNPSDFDNTNIKNRHSEFTFGFVGSIMAYHGLEDLIHAFSDTLNAGVSARLLIVGDGQSVPALKKLAKGLEISDQVLFTGSVSHAQVKDYLCEMDVAIMPQSNWYGSPVKLFEYGVMGKIIIAPKQPPVEEVMQDQEDGILVGSRLELTQAMIRIASSKESFSSMAKCFQTKVLESYTWRKNLDRIVQELVKNVS